MLNSPKATLAALLLTTAVATAADAKELRLATIAPPSHVWVSVAEQLSKELERQPELDLQISIFPAAQLGGEPDTLQQVETGLLDIGIFTVAGLISREESLNAWFTPYLFSDVSSAGAARKVPASQEMLANLSQYQMIGVDYVFAGMRHVLSAKTDISGPDDIDGLKVRITPFPAMQTWWNAMGAVPTPVPLSGVYQALQTGVVDAIDIDLDAAVGLSLPEVSQSLTFTNHMAFPGIVVVSEATWNDLTDAQKSGLTQAIIAASDYGVSIQEEAETKNLDAIASKIPVIKIADGSETFQAATDAFEAEFGSLPLVKDFQQQVRQK